MILLHLKTVFVHTKVVKNDFFLFKLIEVGVHDYSCHVS